MMGQKRNALTVILAILTGLSAVILLMWMAMLLTDTMVDSENYARFTAFAVIAPVCGIVWLIMALKRGKPKAVRIRRAATGILALALCAGAVLCVNDWAEKDRKYNTSVRQLKDGFAFSAESLEKLNGFRDSDNYVKLYDCLKAYDAPALDALFEWEDFPYDQMKGYISGICRDDTGEVFQTVDSMIKQQAFIHAYNEEVAEPNRLTQWENKLLGYVDTFEKMYALFGSGGGGKAVVLELREDGTFYFDLDNTLALPETLRPNTASEVSIVIVSQYSREIVGTYFGGTGGTAYRIDGVLTAYDVSTQELLWQGETVEGGSPPSSIPGDQSYGVGSEPDMTQQLAQAAQALGK